MDFYKRVSYACKQVPRGKVATYGQIALLCQRPRNARQVGYALNRRISDTDVPAHRIINSQGFLSGADAFATKEMQKNLLKSEGVEVDEFHKVNLKKYLWKNTMEEALQLSALFDKMKI